MLVSVCLLSPAGTACVRGGLLDLLTESGQSVQDGDPTHQSSIARHFYKTYKYFIQTFYLDSSSLQKETVSSINCEPELWWPQERIKVRSAFVKILPSDMPHRSGRGFHRLSDCSRHQAGHYNGDLVNLKSFSLRLPSGRKAPCFLTPPCLHLFVFWG